MSLGKEIGQREEKRPKKICIGLFRGIGLVRA
jgi:hypothetical protein